MAPGYHNMDCLVYFTLYHSIEGLKNKLNKIAAGKIKSSLATQTNLYVTPEHASSLTSLCQPVFSDDNPSSTQNTLNDEDDLDDIDERSVDTWNTEDNVLEADEIEYMELTLAPTDEILAADIQKALPSLFNSAAGVALLKLPRTMEQYRLPNHHFRIALCRRLCLPIYRTRRPCRCGKTDVDIFGDHYFECRAHSKMWLHNRCRDINAAWLQRIIHLTGIAPAASAISKEPRGVSAQFPGVRPFDIAIQTSRGMKGLNITITGTTKPTCISGKQETANHKTLTRKEVLKWRGTSRPNKSSSEGDNDSSEPPIIPGHIIVQELVNRGNHLLPAAIDPFISEGPALQWFRYGRNTQAFDASHHNFGRSQGTPIRKHMCSITMQDDDMCGLIRKANKTWKDSTEQGSLFGETYLDTTP
eukprot:15340501-Ditylum_brightwellii.AAC.1